MPYKAQRVRDPIHDLIEFKADEFDDAMWRVVGTRPFQRLRRIKQLGFSEMVYPGATHTRFAHSLGVFNTARQLMDVIQENQVDFRDSLARPALAAALVHDVGHGPFSHAFEDFGRRHSLKLANHESVSDLLIRDSEIADVLKGLGGGFHTDVASIISAEFPETIYHAVVSSQFDADRLDYMRRDRFMSGSSHGVIDYNWLISNLKIGKVPVGIDEEQTGELDTFVIGAKATFAAESYVLGLFQLYPTIYFHKTTRGIEKVFTEILCRCYEVVLAELNKDHPDISEIIRITGLPEKHPLMAFMRDPENIDRVIELDDAVFTGALSLMASGDDAIISNFSKRIRDRKLLKSYDMRIEVQRITGLSMSKDDDSDRIDKIIAEALEKIRHLRDEKGLCILIDTYIRSPYKKIQQSKGPLNQIMVQEPDGSLVDLGIRSRAVAAIRSYKLDRLYYDEKEAASLKSIVKIVEEECKSVT